jgi:hypothetical protein
MGSTIHTHGEIQTRAYQLWQERGTPWGTPETDWFNAEHELASDNSLAELARNVGGAGSRSGLRERQAAVAMIRVGPSGWAYKGLGRHRLLHAVANELRCSVRIAHGRISEPSRPTPFQRRSFSVSHGNRAGWLTAATADIATEIRIGGVRRRELTTDLRHLEKD